MENILIEARLAEQASLEALQAYDATPHERLAHSGALAVLNDARTFYPRTDRLFVARTALASYQLRELDEACARVLVRLVAENTPGMPQLGAVIAADFVTTQNSLPPTMPTITLHAQDVSSLAQTLITLPLSEARAHVRGALVATNAMAYARVGIITYDIDVAKRRHRRIRVRRRA